MREAGDEGADALINTLSHSGQLQLLYPHLSFPLQADKASIDPPAIKAFLFSSRPKPSWYDPDRMLNGQRFFRKYALDIMTLLGSLSLPYCYAASPGNKAIYLTEKMRKSPGKRLIETAHFIIGVMQEKCFDEDADGHILINQTRLIHALVRHHLLAKGQWNLAWGTPVNQEDMAGTNLAFSYIIVAGLKRAQFPVTEKEAEDFLFAWRYIGYQMYIDDELLPKNIAEAQALEQSIKARHVKYSEEGKSLTADLVTHYKNSFPTLPAFFVDGQIRYFLGPELSYYVGLKHQPYKDALVMMMNKMKEKINRSYVDSQSYDKMLKNHLQARARYQ